MTTEKEKIERYTKHVFPDSFLRENKIGPIIIEYCLGLKKGDNILEVGRKYRIDEVNQGTLTLEIASKLVRDLANELLWTI